MRWKMLAAVLLLFGGILSASAQFTEVNAGFTGLSFGKVTFVDYDNDGDLDVLITGYLTNFSTGFTMLYRNDGGGVFTPVATSLPNLGYSATAWADYDHDGDLDLVIEGEIPGSGNTMSRVYRNDGGGSFAQVGTMGGVEFGSAAWADLNNDGTPEPMVAGFGHFYIYRNAGGDVFTNAAVSLPNGSATYLSGADYDNDGKVDLLCSAYAGQFANGCYFWRNNGNGTFTNVLSVNQREFNSMDWGDYDNDGGLDIVMSGGNFTKVFHNDGNSSFTEMPIALPGGGYSAVAWGDFDNDGYLDIILSGDGASGPVTQVYRNNGLGNFTLYWSAPLQLTQGSVAVGDYDNDGRLDILMMGTTNGVKYTKLFHNDVLVPNTPPSAPANLIAERIGKSAVLSWTASTDAQQSGGLTYNVRIGTSPGAANVVTPGANGANGWRRLPAIGNAGTRLAFNITNLNIGTYYWSVQAIDHAYAGSMFAAESSFTIGPPVITNQPQAQVIFAGQTATFTVGASGTDPLSYQWRFNNADIPGATNVSLILSNAQFINQGIYSVAVSDVIGTTSSSNAFLTVNSAPVITNQPLGKTIGLGGGARISVSAIGNTPLAYQWRFNGANIAGGTNSTLLMLNVQFSDAGNYSVLVTNSLGTTLSSNASLNVFQPDQSVHTISAPSAVDMVYDGARDLIYMSSGNSILRYHVGSNIFLTPFQMGTTLAGLDLSVDGKMLIAADHSGSSTNSWIYVVDLASGQSRQVLFPIFLETGTYWTAFGNDGAVLTTSDFVNGSSSNPLRRYDPATDSATNIASVFSRSRPTASGDGSVIVVGEGSVSAGRVYKYDVASRQIVLTTQLNQFSWIHPGANRKGTQFTYSMDHGTAVLNSNLQQINFLGGTYLGPRPVGVVYHPVQDLVFMAWGGSSQVIAYETGGFTQTAQFDFGTGFGTGERTSNLMRISRDGSLLMVRFGGDGINSIGGGVKYLRWSTAAPQITAQPVGTNVAIGAGTTFTVQASGNAPFSYQWFLGNSVVPGATNSSLILTNLQPAQFGAYSVVVFSLYGCVTSSVAQLTLTGPPYIVEQPQGKSVVAGASTTLQTFAVGTDPITYQWRLYGTNIASATSTSLVLANFNFSSDGPYIAVASNSLGSATSQVATVRFVPVMITSRANKALVIYWEGPFTLQSATNVTGPYVDLAAATSPFTNSPAANESRRFFRLRRALP